jgi:hypothetical protein
LGSSHYASASLYNISATAWAGTGAIAAFAIDGNVTVSATSPGDAEANLYYLYASAGAVSSEASVTIGGDVLVEAVAGTGDAYATMTTVYADADGENAIATVSIGGGVTVQASSDDGFAGAYAYGLAAWSYGGAIAGTVSFDLAGVVIAAEDELTFTVEGGDAQTFAVTTETTVAELVTAINAAVEAGDLSGVIASEDGDSLVLTSTVTSLNVSGSYGGTDGVATDKAAGSQSSVTVGGDVTVMATGNAATAYFTYASVTADAEGTVALVDIAGGITAQAAGVEYAYGYVGYLGANAYELDTTATVTIDGDVEATATAMGNTSVSGGTVSFDLAGGVAEDDELTFTVEGGDAQTFAVTTETTVAELVTAINAAVEAGDLSGVIASADGDSLVLTSTVTSLNVSGSYGETAGNTVNAETFYATATASVTWLSAYAGTNAEDSDALLDINGSVIVQATAGQEAYAYSGGGAYARGDDSTATIHIAGDYEVSAVVEAVYASDATEEAAPLGSSHYASASLYDISATAWAGTGAIAAFEIDGNVTVSATSPGDAEASLRWVYAEADALDSEASVTIGGDVTVSATGSGSVIAEIGSYEFQEWWDAAPYAEALDDAAHASVTINGGLAVQADGSTGSALAFMDTMYASADAEDATATVSIGGGVTAQANADGYAQAQILGFAAYTASSASSAIFDVGNVTISAVSAEDEAVATLEGIVATGANAAITADQISLSASGQLGAFIGLAMVAGNGASINVDSLELTVESQTDNADGIVAIGSFGESSINMNSLSVIAADNGADSTVELALGFEIATTPSMQESPLGANDGTLTIGSVAVNLDNVYASILVDGLNADVLSLSGVGDVSLAILRDGVTLIDRSDLIGAMDVVMALENADDESGEVFAEYAYSIVKGFDATEDSVLFSSGGVSVDLGGEVPQIISTLTPSVADASLIEELPSESSEANVVAALLAALDDDTQVAYINLDGLSVTLGEGDSETLVGGADWWAVAYDGDAAGITSLVLIQSSEAIDDTHFVPTMVL